MLDAVYFDGRTTRARTVRIAVQGDQLVIAEPDAPVQRRPLAHCDVQPAPRHAPQRIDLGDGASLEVADKAALAAMLAAAGVRPGAVERVERSWAAVAGALAALFAIAWFGYAVLLPWGAHLLAQGLPQRIEHTLGEQMWPVIDAQMFAASQLPGGRRDALAQRFAQVVAAGGPAPGYRLEFRRTRDGAPNAFALPGGRIVVTDELVGLARDDDALIGVLAHELGHVEHRHTLRNLIQGAALGTVVSLWLGDVSSVLATVTTTLATLSYSRDFERESDEYAIARLRAAGVDTAPMADLLESLEARRAGAGGAPGIWSTHPMTAERAARLRAGG